MEQANFQRVSKGSRENVFMQGSKSKECGRVAGGLKTQTARIFVIKFPLIQLFLSHD